VKSNTLIELIEMNNVKIRPGFMLRKIVGQWVVIPLGGNVQLNQMMTLNETGAFLWKIVENGTSEQTLVDSLLKEYDGIDKEMATEDVREFIVELKEKNLTV